MKIGWSKSRRNLWHAFAFFPGHDTLGALCHTKLSVPEHPIIVKEPMILPIGVPNVDACSTCLLGVRTMRRKYRWRGLTP